jgi:hypothetical protein
MGTHTLTIDDLERWVLSGAHWRVVDISSEHALLEDSRHMYVHGGAEEARIRRPLVIGYTCAPPTPSWTTAEMRRWRLPSAGRSIGWKRRGAWTRMGRPRHAPGTVGE